MSITNEQLIKSTQDMKARLDSYVLDTLDLEMINQYILGTESFLSVIKGDAKTLSEAKGQELVDLVESLILHMRDMCETSAKLADILDEKLDDVIGEETDVIVEETDEDDDDKKEVLKKIDIDDLKEKVKGFPCGFVMSKGKRKGETCNKMSVKGSVLCKIHTKKE